MLYQAKVKPILHNTDACYSLIYSVLFQWIALPFDFKNDKPWNLQIYSNIEDKTFYINIWVYIVPSFRFSSQK